MPIIVVNIKQNRISTDFEDIRLLIFLPAKPPITPEMIITARVIKFVSGTDAEKIVKRRLAVCAKKIIYKELSAAVLVFIEKKKYKTARLIGPPPIPKKDERMPRISPIDKQAKIEQILFVLMRVLLST